jgi:hypothetical protein
MSQSKNRKVRVDRLTKASRNARILDWPIRTGQILEFTHCDGRTVALVIPVDHPAYTHFKKFGYDQ